MLSAFGTSWFALQPETRIYLAVATGSSLLLLVVSAWILRRPPLMRPGERPRYLLARGLGFFASGGWAGVTLSRVYAPSWVLTLATSVGAGLLGAVVLGQLIRLAGPQRTRRPNLRYAIGELGQVSQVVGGEMSKVGMIHLNVRGRPIRAAAVTRYPEDLAIGQRVRVAARLPGGRRLIVEPLRGDTPARARSREGS